MAKRTRSKKPRRADQIAALKEHIEELMTQVQLLSSRPPAPLDNPNHYPFANSSLSSGFGVPSAQIPGQHFGAAIAEDTDTQHTVAMFLADDLYPDNRGVGITRELITENETTLNCIKEIDEVMKAYVKFCRELNRSALARSESLQSVEVKKIVSKLPREFVRHLHRYVFPDTYWGKAILNHCEWFTRREAFSLPLQQLTDAIYDQFKLKKKPDPNYPLAYM